MPLPMMFAVNTACAFNASKRSRIWQRPCGISKNARNTLRNKSTATTAMLKWLWQPCSEGNRTRPLFINVKLTLTDNQEEANHHAIYEAIFPPQGPSKVGQDTSVRLIQV